MNIDQIQLLTKIQAEALAEETLHIKEHTVYLIDFGGYFGYSALVFWENQHIYYANDYQLHHEYLMRQNGKDALRDWYIETMHRKLFTDEELAESNADYSEYQAKENFLRNYYPQRTDYVSAFMIAPSKSEEAEFRRKIRTMVYNPVSFCYMSDRTFVERQKQLLIQLQNAKDKRKDDFDYQKDAFLKEMFNHEYGINPQGDYEVLSAFGNLKDCFNEEPTLDSYFDDLNFSPTQRQAYLAARQSYYKQAQF